MTFNSHIPAPGCEDKKMKLRLVVRLEIFKVLSQRLVDSTSSSDHQKIFFGLNEMLKSVRVARDEKSALIRSNEKRDKVLLHR